LKAGLKRGCNQYLEMQIDTEHFIIDEERITEAAKFDGYYAIITNNLSLDTDKVTGIYRGLWRIEESFRILKTDLRARPVFVWSDNHIKGHFAFCFICLCMLRYLQYLFHEKKGVELSAEQIMKCISDPIAVVQGVFPRCIVTPVCVPQTYLDLAELLNFTRLKTNMTLTNFRASTKLDLSLNLK
jgi:transposase